MKLLLALIHNKNKSRLNKIRPSLENLKNNMPLGFEAEIIEVSSQPEPIPHPIWLTLWIKCIYWHTNRQWEEYKLFQARNILLDLFILLSRMLKTFLNIKSESKRAAVYAVLTDKHIRIWNYFLDSNFDFLICFEDDAVFKDNTINSLNKFLNEIRKIDKPIYLDLAGGNPPEINRIGKLEIRKTKLQRYYKKPAGNTACCYLINKRTIKIFSENIIKMPWLRLLGADWAMNKIFIESHKKSSYVCFHADPPIFVHGSLSGIYKTSI